MELVVDGDAARLKARGNANNTKLASEIIQHYRAKYGESQNRKPDPNPNHSIRFSAFVSKIPTTRGRLSRITASNSGKLLPGLTTYT